MQFKNTRNNFGLIAKGFHWILAILILWLLSVGFAMVGIPPGPDKFWVYALHKSFGILILVLMIGRVLWRQISPRPGPLPTHKTWEDTLAKIVHFALYACIFLMPLSGWIMSSAGGFPAEFFGLFSLPAIVPKNEAIFEFTRNVHGFVAWTILALLVLHFAGAFKHHFIDKDETLQRMTSRKVGLYWGVLFVLVAGFLWTSPVAIGLLRDDGKSEANSITDESSGKEVRDEELKRSIQALDDSDTWLIDMGASSIRFEATQSGEKFEGGFKNFGGKIIFDQSKLDEAYADIWIDITSIETGSGDRDGQAKSADWFDTSKFPRAQFVADSFSKTGPNQYLARGALTIRDQVVLVELPFTLQVRESPEGQAALMEGVITLNRLDFGIGQGQWQSTQTIGNEVKISITVVADSR
ncbi:MAG: cytochrome b/b6 domain-containing protein [Alphaproteobacteria bacterium]|nr:cytochrome b/b6 domain-containing protein [Alphaproteobacteria bacterium]